MRNLEQDASAVAGVLLESRAAAVLQVDQNGQCIVQNLVMALTVDIGKRADATCIVVEFGAIKALLLSGICLHRDPPLDILTVSWIGIVGASPARCVSHPFRNNRVTHALRVDTAGLKGDNKGPRFGPSAHRFKHLNL